MEPTEINLRALKEMRLKRHWSQEQLAEMSGLSIRTIQRIENGENAGFESLKSLAAVFEIVLVDSDKEEERTQIREEETYIQKPKNRSSGIFMFKNEEIYIRFAISKS